MTCWISNKLALVINYHTQIVSALRCETVEDFLHLLSVFHFADSVSIRDHIVSVSFHTTIILLVVFFSLVRYEPILFARSVAPIPK